MYCPEKLKLNKFKHVAIPAPRDYMQRLGMHDTPANQFTGDEPVDWENRKTEILNTAEEEMAYRQWLEEEGKKDNK